MGKDRAVVGEKSWESKGKSCLPKIGWGKVRCRKVLRNLVRKLGRATGKESREGKVGWARLLGK